VPARDMIYRVLGMAFAQQPRRVKCKVEEVKIVSGPITGLGGKDGHLNYIKDQLGVTSGEIMLVDDTLINVELANDNGYQTTFANLVRGYGNGLSLSSLSLSLFLFLLHTLTYSLSHSFSFSYTLAQKHTHTHKLTHTYRHTHTHTHTHTHARSGVSGRAPPALPQICAQFCHLHTHCRAHLNRPDLGCVTTADSSHHTRANAVDTSEATSDAVVDARTARASPGGQWGGQLWSEEWPDAPGLITSATHTTRRQVWHHLGTGRCT
jgi:hypothetical protein